MASPSIPQCQPGSTGPCWYSTPCSSETEASTRETVVQMCGHIRAAANDPYIQQLAGQAYQMYAGRGALIAPGDSIAAAAAAAWWWCKEHMRFVPDEVQLGQLLGKQAQDFLIAPGVMARSGSKKGDCDCFTMMLLSLLTCLGVPWKICTIKCQREMPWRWSHVYSCVTLDSGARLPLDASHGKFPGWEVPAADVFEYAEWDCAGGRIPANLRPMPMGQYRARPLIPSFRSGLGGRPRRNWRGAIGLGEMACDETGCYDDGSGSIASTPLPIDTGGGANSSAVDSFWNWIDSGSTPGSSSAGGSSSSSNPAVANDITSILNQVTRTIGGIVAPQVQYRLPNGTLVTAPAGSVQGSQIISSATSPFSGSTILIMVAVLGGVLLLAGGKH